MRNSFILKESYYNFMPQIVPQMGVFCPFFAIFQLILSCFLCKIFIYATKNRIFMNKNTVLVGRGGFEPPKSKTSDLQSDPFGRSGICPYMKLCCGAGDWTRTHNLLITNQLLCQLSYTGIRRLPQWHCHFCGALGRNRTTDRQIFSLLLYRLSYQGIYGDPERARTVDLQRDRLAL